MGLIKKCVFPAAGYGLRFLPATKAIPKEMLPIISKPIIEYGVEEAMNAGISSMVMVISKYKESIRRHFEDNTDIEDLIKGTISETYYDEIKMIISKCDFNFINQSQMLGLGHAIYTAKPLLDDEPFAVILPDDICSSETESVLMQIKSVYEKFPGFCIVAIQEVANDDTDKYGIVTGEKIEGFDNLYLVNNMIEKPDPKNAPSNLAIIGRYILTSEIFNSLENISFDKEGEIQLTEALMEVAKRGKVIACKFKGMRFDCGNVKGFIKANNHFAELNKII